MKRIIYIISDIDKALAFEWISTHLDKNKFDLQFIILNPKPSNLETFLVEHGFKVHALRCRGKQDWISTIYNTYKILKNANPDIVHCHLMQANIIGLTAAKMAGVKVRYYTRHHSSLHHAYFKKGIWWDKFANLLATKVIAISGKVKEILVAWEKVPEKKIVLIPHGFLLDEFKNINTARVIQFRERYNLPESAFVVGVISRLTEWKGVQYIIPAFRRFLNVRPDAVLLIMNAKGDYEKNILSQLSDISEKNYRLVVFEKDVAAAYKAMNVFVHVPIDDHSEAFGQIYVESLAAGVPAIFTLSGIASDFVNHRVNAIVVPFKDSDAIFEALEEIAVDKDRAAKLSINGCQSVEKQFELKVMIKKLEQLYESA